jgi:hypothetical protein
MQSSSVRVSMLLVDDALFSNHNNIMVYEDNIEHGRTPITVGRILLNAGRFCFVRLVGTTCFFRLIIVFSWGRWGSYFSSTPCLTIFFYRRIQ